MPYEIFAVPGLICFVIGFYYGIKVVYNKK